MQAFLQRVVNSGGRIEREYGLGKMRTDLLVLWRYNKKTTESEIQKIVIELKLIYKSLDKTIKDGVLQTLAYMDRCGADDGHLVVFDRTDGKFREDRIFRREEKFDSTDGNAGREKTVVVWGM